MNPGAPERCAVPAPHVAAVKIVGAGYIQSIFTGTHYLVMHHYINQFYVIQCYLQNLFTCFVLNNGVSIIDNTSISFLPVNSYPSHFRTNMIWFMQTFKLILRHFCCHSMSNGWTKQLCGTNKLSIYYGFEKEQQEFRIWAIDLFFAVSHTFCYNVLRILHYDYYNL